MKALSQLSSFLDLCRPYVTVEEQSPIEARIAQSIQNRRIAKKPHGVSFAPH